MTGNSATVLIPFPKGRSAVDRKPDGAINWVERGSRREFLQALIRCLDSLGYGSLAFAIMLAGSSAVRTAEKDRELDALVAAAEGLIQSHTPSDCLNRSN